MIPISAGGKLVRNISWLSKGTKMAVLTAQLVAPTASVACGRGMNLSRP